MNFLVGFRNKDGVIQKANVSDVDNHIEAINATKDMTGAKHVLALINKEALGFKLKEESNER